LSEDPYAGIGNNPTIPGWYGGKVEFRGRLQSQGEGTTKSFKILLENCTLGTSCRFMRRFGSWSFLRIKIPLGIVHDSNSNLALFFQKRFVLWGHVFRACYAKDDNVFFYWTNERFPPTSLTPGRLSFEDFIMWHNPLEEEGNAHQVFPSFVDLWNQ
jgi:RNA-dependent RNA polymerase